MSNYKIGIIVADFDEYAPLQETVEKGDFEEYSFLGRKGHKFTVKTDSDSAQVVSLHCGIGKVNAAAAAMHLIDIGCNVILNFGLSGGISRISRGELCTPDRFVEHDFDLSAIGYKPYEKPSQEYIYFADNSLLKLFSDIVPQIKTGTAVTGDSFVCDPSVRDSLRDNLAAVSCDMETAAIAYACHYSKVPFLSLRRISDDAGDDAIDTYREMNSLQESVLWDLMLQLINRLVSK